MELQYGYTETQDEDAIRKLYNKKFSKAHEDLDNGEYDPTGGSLIVNRKKFVEGNKPRFEEGSGIWPENRQQWRM